jgi:hypothetical protein
MVFRRIHGDVRGEAPTIIGWDEPGRVHHISPSTMRMSTHALFPIINDDIIARSLRST